MATGPLIAIVGQTASGKSDLAMQLAQKFNGEIICADSRTIYKGMDIATAKPTKIDQARIPHHLLDVLNPDEPFSVADFQQMANQAIDDILSRRKVPLLVGGSGLYVDSVVYDYSFSDQSTETDPHNPRHRKSGSSPVNNTLRSNLLMLGLSLGTEDLRKRIEKRVDTMLQDGFVEEAIQIGERFGWENALQTIYGSVNDYVEGRASLDELRIELVKRHMNLAKRQRTWFKRNKSIHWISSPLEAIKLTTEFLNNQS